MSKFLIFQLYGPMASWGDIAVGERRPTAGHPSKSAVTGLLAASLGICRSEEDRLQKLADNYGIAVRVDAPGEVLRDYHTSQVPPVRCGHKYTRREELASYPLHTILSQRDYRMDACYAVAVWLRGQDAPYGLTELVEHMKHPHFVLYLGRKSCPLSLPLRPQVITASTLREAFDQFTPPEELTMLWKDKKVVHYYWEDLNNDQSGMSATFVNPRCDQPISRRRWQFQNRDEFCYLLTQTEKTEEVTS